jgi:DNA-binding NtrC family response regulator
LEHALTRAAVLARGPYLDEGHFDLRATRLEEGEKESGDGSLEAMEAAHVQRVLREAGGVKRRAAEILKISRTRLDRIIEKHGLELPE